MTVNSFPISTDHLHVLLLFAAAHILGDFLFQTNGMVKGKQARRPSAFLLHGFVHLALLAAVMGRQMPNLLMVLVPFAILHVLIDTFKEAVTREFAEKPLSARRDLALFGLDQLAHAIAIVCFSWLIASQYGRTEWMFAEHSMLFDPWLVALWVWLAGLVLTTRTGGMVIAMVVAPILEELRRTRPDDADEDAEVMRLDVRGLQHGGRLIGWLERALIFLLVMNGAIAGVGFLAAAKSVFRFGEISDPRQRKEAEYILIGTLLSFTWGMFAAWLTVLALRMV